MKLKTLLNNIDCLKDKGKISALKAKQVKEVIGLVWGVVLEKHHISGSRNGTINNTVKIEGILHNMLHTYAYKYIFQQGLLENYLKWLKKTFGAEISNMLARIKKAL